MDVISSRWKLFVLVVVYAKVFAENNVFLGSFGVNYHQPPASPFAAVNCSMEPPGILSLVKAGDINGFLPQTVFKFLHKR